MPELTPDAIKQAAAKEDAMHAAQDMAQKMNLVATLLDTELKLRVPYPQLQADILSSVLAGVIVTQGLKCEKIVGQLREKTTIARRFEKANADLKAAVPGHETDAVAPEVVDEVAKEIGAEPEAFDAGAFNAKHGLDTAEPSLIVKP